MPTVSQPNSSVSITIGGTEYNCQFTTITWNPGGSSAPDVMLTACPDGVLASAGSYNPAVLSGTVAGDTSDSGITTALLDAVEDGTDVAVVYTMFNDNGTVAWQWTFDAHVAPFDLPFTRPGTFMHDLTLTGTSPATRVRPA